MDTDRDNTTVILWNVRKSRKPRMESDTRRIGTSTPIVNALLLARYVGSTIFMVGVSPLFYAIWLSWRILSLPFPDWIYQKLDDIMFGSYQKTVLFFFFNCTGTKLYYSGEWQDLVTKKERVLYIANHQSVLDWILTNAISVQQGSIGNLRYVMKDGNQFIPLYGHYFYQHGCIYVRRGNFKADKMMKGLEYLTHPDIPSWVVIYPEGTRFFPDTKRTIERSQKMAIDNKLPVLEHHLTPRSKGMFLTLEELRNNFDAVYDLTVVYGNTVDENGCRKRAPGFKDFLMNKCPFVHFHCKRIPIENIPTGENDLKHWMHRLFMNKDELVHDFYSRDPLVREAALKGSTERHFHLRYSIYSVLFYVTLSIPVLYSEWGRWLYIQTFLYGSLGGYLWLTIKSVC